MSATDLSLLQEMVIYRQDEKLLLCGRAHVLYTEKFQVQSCQFQLKIFMWQMVRKTVVETLENPMIWHLQYVLCIRR